MSVKSVDVSIVEIIPSQAKELVSSLGVCREHEPTAKAKMCSDLNGDIER